LAELQHLHRHLQGTGNLLYQLEGNNGMEHLGNFLDAVAEEIKLRGGGSAPRPLPMPLSAPGSTDGADAGVHDAMTSWIENGMKNDPQSSQILVPEPIRGIDVDMSQFGDSQHCKIYSHTMEDPQFEEYWSVIKSMPNSELCLYAQGYFDIINYPQIGWIRVPGPTNPADSTGLPNSAFPTQPVVPCIRSDCPCKMAPLEEQTRDFNNTSPTPTSASDVSSAFSRYSYGSNRCKALNCHLDIKESHPAHTTFVDYSADNQQFDPYFAVHHDSRAASPNSGYATTRENSRAASASSEYEDKKHQMFKDYMAAYEMYGTYLACIGYHFGWREGELLFEGIPCDGLAPTERSYDIFYRRMLTLKPTTPVEVHPGLHRQSELMKQMSKAILFLYLKGCVEVRTSGRQPYFHLVVPQSKFHEVNDQFKRIMGPVGIPKLAPLHEVKEATMPDKKKNREATPVTHDQKTYNFKPEARQSKQSNTTVPDEENSLEAFIGTLTDDELDALCDNILQVEQDGSDLGWRLVATPWKGAAPSVPQSPKTPESLCSWCDYPTSSDSELVSPFDGRHAGLTRSQLDLVLRGRAKVEQFESDGSWNLVDTTNKHYVRSNVETLSSKKRGKQPVKSESVKDEGSRKAHHKQSKSQRPAAQNDSAWTQVDNPLLHYKYHELPTTSSRSPPKIVKDFADWEDVLPSSSLHEHSGAKQRRSGSSRNPYSH
jgi:hypothetical protein